MQDISQHIIQVIDEKHLKPKPRWQFLLTNYCMWIITILTVILGALATAVVLFEITHSQFLDLAPDFSPVNKLLLATPFFWIILLIIFTAIGYYNVRHTHKGYRYHAYWIVIFSIMLSISMGSIVYALGGGERLESFFYQNISWYRYIVNTQTGSWQSPKQGRLTGYLVDQPSSNQLVIWDVNKREWLVLAHQPLPKLPLKMRLVIIGQQIDDHKFVADKIMPFFRLRQWNIIFERK